MIQVCWEGPQFVNSSLAHVNRSIAAALLDVQDIALSLLPTTPDQIPADWMKRAEELTSRYQQPPVRADVHIRHEWPPSFVPSPARVRVLFQPWEFGAVPKSWVPFIQQHVDEVWVYSAHTKAGYIRSGVPAATVFVVPLGVDLNLFRPEGSRYPLATDRQVRFLFVGGTLYRKGIDKLLAAYAQAFSSKDDVCLVIKDQGVDSYYRGLTAEDQIRELQQSPDGPEILYLDQDLPPEDLAALYRACDVLIHPYRGESFGLPILEAMAAGVPPVIPALGPALEFTEETGSVRVPAHTVAVDLPGLDTVRPPEAIDVNVRALAAAMRRLYEEPAERARLSRGALTLATSHSWARTGMVVTDRIRHLAAHRPSRPRPSALESLARRVADRLESPAPDAFYAQFYRCFSPGDRVMTLGAVAHSWPRGLRDRGMVPLLIPDLPEGSLLEPEQFGVDAVQVVNSVVGQVDGVALFCVLERLSVSQLLRLWQAVCDRMSYRGRCLVVVPNLGQDTVLRGEFWLDGRRQRPHPVRLLQAVAAESGFRTIVTGKSSADRHIILFASRLAEDNPFAAGR